MSVELNSVPDIVTRAPTERGIGNAHDRPWADNHGATHRGDGDRGFPVNGGNQNARHGTERPGHGGNQGPDRPGKGLDNGGDRGIDRPNGGFDNGGNRGVDRPSGGYDNGGNRGADRPAGGFNNGGADRPGSGFLTGGNQAPGHQPGPSGPIAGLVRDVVALPGHVFGHQGVQAQGHGHAHAHGQGNVHGHGHTPPSGPAWVHGQAQSVPSQSPLSGHAQPLSGHATMPAGVLAGTLGMSAQVAHAQGTQHAGMPPPGPGHAPHGGLPATAARADASPVLSPATNPQQVAAGLRGEALPLPRGEGLVAQRVAAHPTLPANPGMPTQSANAAPAANTAGTTAAQAPAATNAPSAPAPAGATQAAAHAQGAEARNPANPVAVDRGQHSIRADIAGTYTGEGPQRRRLRESLRTLSSGGLAGLLVALGAQGATGAGRDPAAIERELRETAMQWLFWLLAIVAYACVAFALIGLLPTGTLAPALESAGSRRGWTGGFALIGLLAGVGAWYFARRMAQRDTGDCATRGRRRR